MKLRALAGIAVAALVAASAAAFEFTSWYGNLTCAVKAKVQGERVERQTEVSEGVSLSTTDTAFGMGPIAGSNLDGLIEKRNDTHYRAAQPTSDPGLADFTAWVKAKILARAGVDVDLATVEMTGTFTLIQGFTKVKVNIKIKWSGTVASGEHIGKPVSGFIKLKGTLPRD